MTPEELMRDALRKAAAGWDAQVQPIPEVATDIVEHGAAAIRRALADQRATAVAWVNALADDCQGTATAYKDGPDTELGRRVGYLRLMSQRIREGAIEAWAARTGFKPPAHVPT